MKRTYYLSVVKPDKPEHDYPVKINKKGFFGSLYTFQLRSHRMYASLLSYPSAVFLKFVSPLFSFKEEDGKLVKRKQVGSLVIRTTA